MWQSTPPGSHDLAFACDDISARSDDDFDARLCIGITRFANCVDPPGFDTDVCFDHLVMVNDDSVGNDGIDNTLSVGSLALAHSVTDNLAATKLDFIAIDGRIALDLDDEFGIREP